MVGAEHVAQLMLQPVAMGASRQERGASREEPSKRNRRGGRRQCGLDLHGKYLTIRGPSRLAIGNGKVRQSEMASRYRGLWGFSSGSGLSSLSQ